MNAASAIALPDEATATIDYVAPPTIEDFLFGERSDEVVRLLMGPVGSGKTSGCCVELLRRAIDQPVCADGIRHSRALFVRNTYAELRDTTRKTFEQWMPQAICHWQETEFTCVLRFDDVECEVLFRALDRPQDVKKLKSLELTFCYINELSEIPLAVFDLVQTRLGRFPRKIDAVTKENPRGEFWSGLWADTNPPDSDHWIYRLFEEEKPEVTFTLPDGRVMVVRYVIWKQPDGLGPNAENLENLPPGYYQRLILGKAEDWIKVFARGLYGFVKSGKPVYPEWNDNAQVIVVVPAGPPVELLLGMDFGLTPAAVLGQRDKVDGQLQIFAELVATRLGAVGFSRELSTLIKAKYPGRPVRGWGDPAGNAEAQTDERTPLSIVQAAGLPVDAAPTNDFTLRREAVAGLCTRVTMKHRPALVIDPACRVLRKAMGGGYAFKRVQVSGDEKFRDKPDKGPFSHVAEALQYLCVGEGEDDRAVYGTTNRRVRLHFKSKRSVRGLA